MFLRLTWITASVGMCMLTPTSPVISTWTCVDSVSRPQFTISCDPLNITIHAFDTGSGGCTGDGRTKCAGETGSLANVRQHCNDRISCVFTVSDYKRPTCAAASDPFYIFISHSCIQPAGSPTTKASTIPRTSTSTTTTTTTTSTKTSTSTTTNTTTYVPPSPVTTTFITTPSPSLSGDMTHEDEITIIDNPPMTPDSSEEQNETNNKRQTPKVLVVALPLAVLLIVVVIIIVLVCVLRKRNTTQETDFPRQSSPVIGGPSSSRSDHGEVKADNLAHGEHGGYIRYSFAQGLDEHESSAYSTAHIQERVDIASVTQPDQPSDMYDEVRHENKRKTLDFVREGEQSTSDQKSPHQLCVDTEGEQSTSDQKSSHQLCVDTEGEQSTSDQKSPHQLRINTEEHAEADITDIYSAVNKVRRDPDELELHDNPMYGGRLNKL